MLSLRGGGTHIFFFTTCTTKPRHSLIIRTRLLFSVFFWNPLMSSILSEVGKWPFLNVWTLSWGTAVLSVVHIRTLLVLKDLLSRLVCDRFLFCFNFLLLTTFWHFLSKNRKLLRGVKNHFTKQCQNYNRISWIVSSWTFFIGNLNNWSSMMRNKGHIFGGNYEKERWTNHNGTREIFLSRRIPRRWSLMDEEKDQIARFSKDSYDVMSRSVVNPGIKPYFRIFDRLRVEFDEITYQAISISTF